MSVATLDHVIVGVSDLEQGVAAFTAATGVVPVRGGQHPGRGTENALVSLGNGAYLEIIAPQRDAADNPMVKSLRSLQRPTVIGWALQVKDAAAAHPYLRDRDFEVTELRPGSRRTTSGDLLEWTTFGLPLGATNAVPFLIHWGANTRHPSATSPTGCVLESFEVRDPEAPTISRLVEALGVAVPVSTAERTNIILNLQCGDRHASFTTE